jgi:DNA mismatch endonuclease (patch repair protein)
MSARSDRMVRVPRSGTKPERTLRKLMCAAVGRRHKLILDASGLAGRPDVVVPSLRLAIVAHGCFWHS